MSNQQDTREPLAAGQRLHKYELVSLLGRGGTALTYLAEDGTGRGRVAIKEFCPPSLVRRMGDGSLQPVHRAAREVFGWSKMRFLDEAHTMERFRHASLVRVLNVFEFNNTAYMVMAWEQGEPWADLLQRAQARSESELYAIILPVLDGLAVMHAMGFLHRDVKPANIYIRSDGSPVLLDFGSAGRAEARPLRGIPTRVTPGYSPVEQYPSSRQPQGPWTDIYSCGATLYKALSGHRPVNAVRRLSLARQTGRDPYRPVARVVHGAYPPQLLNAVDHALKLRGSDRPPNLMEWRAELCDRPRRDEPLPGAGTLSA